MALTKVSTGMLSADAASVDLNIDAGTMFIDASANRVGIGNTSPATALDVTGTVTADGLTVDGGNTIRLNPSSGDDFLTISQGTSDANITADSTAGNANLKLFTTASGTTRERLDISFNGDISFYEDTGTTAKFFWDASAESLGIGTSSPSSSAGWGTLLEVSGTTNAGIKLTETDTANGDFSLGVTAGTFRIWDETATAFRLTLDGSGNFGIGTTSPAQPLEILKTSAGAVVPMIQLRNGSSSAGSGTSIKFMHSTVSNATSGTCELESIRYSGNLGALTFKTSNNGGTVTERMRIDDTGVGIGTSDPLNPLHIQDSTLLQKMLITNDDFVNGSAGTSFDVSFGATSGTTYSEIRHLTNGRSAWGNFVLARGGGNVLVGTTSSSAKLTVHRDTHSTSTDLVNISTDQYDAGSVFRTGEFVLFGDWDGAADKMLALKSAGSDVFVVDATGDVLVGTSSVINTGIVSVQFAGASQNGISLKTTTASNGSKFLSFANSGGTEIGYVEENTNSSVNYSVSSDQRLKDNIVDAPSASDDIDAIQVRSFDWKINGSRQKYGMVAQELQTVAPEAVSGSADSEKMMGVDYSKLVPMMLKEIQSLRARVAQLES